jgi:hypothetical protein
VWVLGRCVALSKHVTLCMSKVDYYCQSQRFTFNIVCKFVLGKVSLPSIVVFHGLYSGPAATSALSSTDAVARTQNSPYQLSSLRHSVNVRI